MGYIVKEDGTRAWSTTELNCPQTQEGECVCQDNETAGEQTLFDKAEEIVDIAASIDAAGGNATLLQAAKMMPEDIQIPFYYEKALNNKFNTAGIWEYSGGAPKIHFQNMAPGDIVTVFVPFGGEIDEKIVPYIRRAIIYKGSSNLSGNGLDSYIMPFLVNTEIDGSVRLFEYAYTTYSEYGNAGYRKGRELSKIDDHGAYALTGYLAGTLYDRKYEPFLKDVFYSFLKYAFIADGGIYMQFQVIYDKVSATFDLPIRSQNICVHLPKNEIIKAIEQEMAGEI